MAALAASIDIDLFDAETRDDPYAAYRRLRDAGPVCHMERHGLYAMGRYRDLRDALTNWTDFSSGSGVAMNDLMNRLMAGTVLASDPPQHKRLRQILGTPIGPARLGKLRPHMRGLAMDRVRELKGGGRFDAMRRLAMLLPLSVVSDLVGLPEEGRERMLDWAAAAFNGMAPAGVPLSDGAFPVMKEMVDYITDPDLIGRLRPDGWAAQLWSSVEDGTLTEEEYRSIIQGYVSPSLDTTIFAVGNLLWLLATHPDQWRALKATPALQARCINESLRHESPALGFSRLAKRDLVIDGVAVPAGARIMTVLPAANRDERHYADPDRFDIQRDASDHLAFGGGVHRCIGGSLAMLEIGSVLEALVELVDHIEPGDGRRADNAVLRGFDHLEISLH
ncbi:cytochrome P450 [Sphingomonas sp. YL-JM2C]